MGNSMQPYVRKANYYETDQMGVIHHSNYIRWFEEARIDLMEKIGFGYDKMEQIGIISPVLSVSCTYKAPVRFNDTVEIFARIESFNGVKMKITYEVRDKSLGEIRATGESMHCFLSKDTSRPVKMKQDFKEVYEVLLSMVQAED